MVEFSLEGLKEASHRDLVVVIAVAAQTSNHSSDFLEALGVPG
jgi:hypothetical protein